jgi:hypothetical protein
MGGGEKMEIFECCENDGEYASACAGVPQKRCYPATDIPFGRSAYCDVHWAEIWETPDL